MISDFDQFKSTYITESLELLAEMEEKLFEVENGDDDVELLHAIFRCVHSIKGGAGAFGFSQITSFTHEFEFFLDSLREGKLTVNETISDILFRGRDVVEQLVQAAAQGQTLDDDFGKDVFEQIKTINAGNGAAASPTAALEASANTKKSNEILMYSIAMTAHPDLFKTGNEPILLFKELGQLGSLDVRCIHDKVPYLGDVVPDQCYMSWELDLDSTASEADIREIFEFVEDECELEIMVLGGFEGPPIDDADDASGDTPEAPTAADNAAPAEQAAAAKPAATAPAAQQTQSATIRVDTDKVDRLVNMVGELVITQGMLHMQAHNIPKDEYPEIMQGIEELAQHTRELQEAVMAVRMQAVKSIFSRMPRIVRDLSKKLGKNIRLEMSGETTEVDKTIIEQLSDPLTHMIRNSIDHGIELPEKRSETGKNQQGCIHLSAQNHGGRIEITIEDDGGGINRERVRKGAIAKGLISESDPLTPEEIDHLIFAPGFSTAEQVSDVSGRGVGMDVVRKNIESIGGMVSVENTPGKGSKFTISLPLTLAILDGMAVRCGHEQYIIPIANIIETMRPAANTVNHLATGIDVINVRGEFIPLIYLYRLFGILGTQHDVSKALVVLIENGKEKYGIVVDELIGQQQVVIKSIEQNSDPVQGISGATILGDGKVSLILDTVVLYRLGTTAKERHAISHVKEVDISADLPPDKPQDTAVTA